MVVPEFDKKHDVKKPDNELNNKMTNEAIPQSVEEKDELDSSASTEQKNGYYFGRIQPKYYLKLQSLWSASITA